MPRKLEYSQSATTAVNTGPRGTERQMTISNSGKGIQERLLQRWGQQKVLPDPGGLAILMGVNSYETFLTNLWQGKETIRQLFPTVHLYAQGSGIWGWSDKC